MGAADTAHKPMITVQEAGTGATCAPPARTSSAAFRNSPFLPAAPRCANKAETSVHFVVYFLLERCAWSPVGLPRAVTL